MGAGSLTRALCRATHVFQSHPSSPAVEFLIPFGPRTHRGALEGVPQALWKPAPYQLLFRADAGITQPVCSAGQMDAMLMKPLYKRSSLPIRSLLEACGRALVQASGEEGLYSGCCFPRGALFYAVSPQLILPGPWKRGRAHFHYLRGDRGPSPPRPDTHCFQTYPQPRATAPPVPSTCSWSQGDLWTAFCLEVVVEVREG